MNRIEMAKDFTKKTFKEVGKENHYLVVFHILQEDLDVQDEEILVAGLLHDTLEDTNTTYKEIKDCFSVRVANLVREVSHPKNYTDEQRVEYYEKIKSISDDAKTIKMADFVSHLQNFIKIYKRGEQNLYPKFKNNDRYLKSIREFLDTCQDSSQKSLVTSLTNELEVLL